MKNNSREEKIKFLNGIRSGIIPIKSLQPRLFRVEVYVYKKGEFKWYINNKEVDHETYLKEFSRNTKGDRKEIIADGMPLNEWKEFVKNNKDIKCDRISQPEKKN